MELAGLGDWATSMHSMVNLLSTRMNGTAADLLLTAW